MIADQEYCWQDVELAMIDLQLGRFDRLEGSRVQSAVRQLTDVYYNSMPREFCRWCGVEGIISNFVQECEKCHTKWLEMEEYA